MKSPTRKMAPSGKLNVPPCAAAAGHAGTTAASCLKLAPERRPSTLDRKVLIGLYHSYHSCGRPLTHIIFTAALRSSLLDLDQGEGKRSR